MPCGRHEIMTEVAGRNEWKVSAGQCFTAGTNAVLQHCSDAAAKHFPLKARLLLGSRHRAVVYTRSAGWPGQIWSRRDQG